MADDMEKRVDDVETKFAKSKAKFKRELAEMGLAWIALAGRAIWFAGMWKRQYQVTWSITTIGRALERTPRVLEPQMVAIAAAVPGKAGRWHNGRLVVTYPKLAEGVAKVDPSEVNLVCEAWRGALHPRAVFDDKRRRSVEARLADGVAVETILLAIKGVASSPKHCEKGWTDITRICKDAESVDKYARWATDGLPPMLKPDEEASMLSRIGGGR